MTYHVARNNQQLGTFSKEEILSRYNSGAILPTDLVWTDGMATWEPASKVFGAPAAPDGGGMLAPATPPPFAPPPITGVATPMTTPPDVKPPKPDNYLVWAIITTLLCCLPLGIVAIIFAAQVDGKYHSGDYQGARNASDKARLFSIISAVSGVVVAVVYIIVVVFAVAGGAAGARGGY
jgi:hypothetical protein